ncbi:hypothetical protein PRABACTJOHN_01151 [Parabacteroides johnsonii DSM 18315]|uniref:Uncharacterized protein n=1 Tax=Parabacteroides johnsonii DSM 18315 TaxID=537006 RepID=B7B801_9BACT|nr:hypothetical protein PRABACTJOHN_01151 [Parabacteroides johnsonii DSM 18315]
MSFKLSIVNSQLSIKKKVPPKPAGLHILLLIYTFIHQRFTYKLLPSLC